MRDKGLVFEEMRRQRRALKSPWSEVTLAWVVGVAVVLVAAGVFEARSAAKRQQDRDGAATWSTSISGGSDRQPWGGGNAAKSK